MFNNNMQDKNGFETFLNQNILWYEEDHVLTCQAFYLFIHLRFFKFPGFVDTGNCKYVTYLFQLS